MLKKIIVACLFFIPIIKISALDKYPITIKKYDQFGSETSDVFRFKIKNIDTNQYLKDNGSEIMETTVDGIYYSDFELDSGTYEIENIDYPFHYFPLNNNTRFTINEETPFLDGQYIIEDYVKKDVGQIKISRTVKSMGTNGSIISSGLSGYEYEIYAQDDITDVYGKIIHKQNQLVDRVKTDENGVAYSSELPFGYYYIKDVTESKEYNRFPNRYNVSFKYNADLKRKVIIQEENYSTEHSPLYMEVTKVNEDLIDPRIKDDLSFKLCKHLTNECVKQYRLSDFDDGKEQLGVVYDEYYLGLFSEDDLVRRYDINFSKDNNTLKVLIDFIEFRNEKGEVFPEIAKTGIEEETPDVIIELPETGNRNSYFIYEILIFLIIFSNYLGIKQYKN